MKERKIKSFLSAFLIIGLLAADLTGVRYLAYADTDSFSTSSEISTDSPSDKNGDFVPGDVIICVTDTDDHSRQDTADDSDISPETAAGFHEELLMDVTDSAREIANESSSFDPPEDLTADGAVYEENTVLKLVHSDSMTTEQLIEYYKDQPGVIFAEPNYINSIEDEIYLSEEPYEPVNVDTVSFDSTDYTCLQYAYGDTASHGINIPDWNNPDNKNAEGTVVAVLDSGVDYNHPDLVNVMWNEGNKYEELKMLGGGEYGINVAYNTKDSTDPMDDNSHGTHCAGIIAAQWNDFGISGGANGCKIMAVKHTCNAKGQSNNSDSLKGLNYIKTAKELGVNVTAVNCSFGGMLASLSSAYAARSLESAGIVLCYASGNAALNNDFVSAGSSILSKIRNCIIVDSSTSSGERSSFSDYGVKNTSVFAPGSDIFSTIPGSQAEPLSNLDYLPAAKDVSGNILNDDYKGDALGFSYEPNTNGGITFTKKDGEIEFDDITLPADPAQRDPDTIETSADTEKMKDAGFQRLITTIRPKESLTPLSDDGRYTFILSSKCSSPEGVYIYCKVFAKTLEGKWERPALSSPLFDKYTLSLYELDPQKFNTENPEFRLVADSNGKDPGRAVKISVNCTRISSADKKIYAYMSGTSMATPATVAAVTIAAAKFKNDSAAKRAARILASTTTTEQFETFCETGGLVNVANMLNESTYTPVIDSFELKQDGLHIGGFFFGDISNTEVMIKQDDKIWKSPDSLSINSVSIADDTCEIITNVPDGLSGGELSITVVNKAAADGGKSYTKYFTIYDPKMLKPGYYTPINADYPENLVNMYFYNGIALNGKIYFLGENSINSKRSIWCFSPDDSGTRGSFKELDFYIDSYSLSAWNGKLLFIGEDAKLYIADPESGDVASARFSTGDVQFTPNDGYILYNDGHDEGRKILLFRTPYNSETEAYDNTEVWGVDPWLMRADLLGTLNHSYNTAPFSPVITHRVNDSSETVYFMGKNSDMENTDPKLLAESFTFTPDRKFASKDLDITPENSTINITEKEKYSGVGLKNGIFLTGCYEIANTYPSYVTTDNYFASYADLDAGGRFTANSNRINYSRLFVPVNVALDGKLYCYGYTSDNPNDPVFCYTEAETLPAYGDKVIYPDDPSEETDKTVKAKKLTLDPGKISLKQGETAKVSANVVWQDPSVTTKVVYESSCENIVRVSPYTGELTAMDPGTAVITAYCGNIKAACKVTVTSTNKPQVNADPSEPIELFTGEMSSLNILNAYSTGNETITYKSSNNKVATVNKGLITAKGPGNATVTVTHKSGKTITPFEFKVNVTDISIPKKAADDKAVKLSVSKSSVKLDSGSSLSLNAILKGAGYKNRVVSVNSTNESILSVTPDNNGLLFPGSKKDQGSCGFTLTADEAGTAYAVVESFDPAVPDRINRVLIKVTVNAPTESLKFSVGENYGGNYITPDGDLVLNKGLTYALDCKYEPSVNTDRNIRWGAKGGAIKVKNGVITAVSLSKKDKNGDYIPSILTVKCGKKENFVKVTVIE